MGNEPINDAMDPEDRWATLALMHLEGQADQSQQHELGELLRDRADRQDAFVLMCFHARLMQSQLGGALAEDQQDHWQSNQAMRDLLENELSSPTRVVDISRDLESRREKQATARQLRLTESVADDLASPAPRVIVIPTVLAYSAFAAAALLVLGLVWLALPDRAGPAASPNADAVPTQPADPSDTPAPQPKAVVASVTQQFDLVWGPAGESGVVQPAVGEPLRDGDVVDIKLGLVELELGRGARVVLRGPCRVVMDGENALVLEHGQMGAHCPRTALGFAVQTPTGRVVDLGTEFAVDVDRQGQTEVYVQTGVVAAGAEGGDLLTMTQGQAAQITPGTNLTSLLDLTQTRLSDGQPLDQLRLRALGIISVSPTVRLVNADGPLDLADLASDTQLFLIPEQRRVVSNSPVEVTTTRTGAIQDFDNDLGFLEPQVAMDSYLIHGDLITDAIVSEPIDAVITFDRPIAGVAATLAHLLGSDAAFGDARVDYAVAGPNRHNEVGDVIRISPDRKTLTLKLGLGLSIDQLRVFVTAPRN